MAAFNFPNSPSTNDLHTENGVTFKWNGTKWLRVGNSYSDISTLNVSGIGTFGGKVGIADSIVHTGNENTSIRFPSTSELTVETGGVERFRIDSIGRVGVGTAAPKTSFEVRDAKANVVIAKDGLTIKQNNDIATSYDLLQIGAGGALASYSIATVTADTQFIHNAYRHSGNNWKYRYADSAARIRMNSPQGAIIFDNAAAGSADGDITFSERLRITSGGQLELSKDQDGVTGRPTNRVVFKDTDSSVAANQPIGEISWYSTDAGMANINSYIRGINEATNGSGALTFGVKASGSSEIEALRITSAGRVGVGTITPHTSYRFDIRHTSDSILHLGQNNNTLAGMGNDSWNAVSFQGTNCELGLYKDNSGNFSYIMGTYQGSTDIPLVFRSGNRAERLRITPTGRIGINQASPDVKLHISGTNQDAIIRLESTDTGLGQDELIGGIEFEKNDASGAGAGIAGGIRCRSDDSYGARTYLAFSTRENSTGSAATDTEQFRILSQGGVTFNGDAAQANALDDYEEGSWTPIMYAWNGTQDQSYDTQTGNYIKIGRQVIANFHVDFSNKGTVSGNYVFIGGLPFNHAGTCAGTMVTWGWAMGSNIGWIAGDISSTATVAWVTYHDNNNNNTGYLSSSFLYDNSQIKGTLIYRAA